MQGVRDILGTDTPPPGSIRAVKMGTKVTINALLERKGGAEPRPFSGGFWHGGNHRLDGAAVRARFAELAALVPGAPGPEDMARGFLRIAVDNIPNAIKKISIQRGHDVTGYTLQCFGGAGGQHACLVADAWGMGQVFIHPLAGVLSAFGMGLAEIRALREVQFDAPLTDTGAAGPGFAGCDAVQSHKINTRMTDPEILKSALRSDWNALASARIRAGRVSGGAGGWGQAR